MWQVLAQAAWQQNRPNRATLIGRAIAKRAHNEGWLDLEIDVLAMLGRGCLKSNMPDIALPALEVVMELPRNVQPAWESAAYNLGVALWQLGRYDEAAVQWRSVEPWITDEEVVLTWPCVR